MPNSSDFQALRREKLGQQISRQLLEAIIAGRYAPGSLLPSERELTEMFGASRVAVPSTCCRVCSNVVAVAMRSTVNQSVAKVAKARYPTRTIAALGPMPIVSAGSAYVNVAKRVPTSLKKPCGLMPVSCFGIRRCFAKSTSDA